MTFLNLINVYTEAFPLWRLSKCHLKGALTSSKYDQNVDHFSLLNNWYNTVSVAKFTTRWFFFFYIMNLLSWDLVCPRNITSYKCTFLLKHIIPTSALQNNCTSTRSTYSRSAEKWHICHLFSLKMMRVKTREPTWFKYYNSLLHLFETRSDHIWKRQIGH